MAVSPIIGAPDMATFLTQSRPDIPTLTTPSEPLRVDRRSAVAARGSKHNGRSILGVASHNAPGKADGQPIRREAVRLSPFFRVIAEENLPRVRFMNRQGFASVFLRRDSCDKQGVLLVRRR